VPVNCFEDPGKGQPLRPIALTTTAFLEL
jgi:hypothetical protein